MKKGYRHNNFTEAKHIPFEGYLHFEKIGNMIEKTNDGELLEDAYRMLGFLMQKIIIKREKRWKFRKISVGKLIRKFGMCSKEGILSPLFQDILDHCYARRIGDREILFGEPYNFNMEQMEALINFCKERKLKFAILRTAQHFPNETIKIGIVEIKKDKDEDLQ